MIEEREQGATRLLRASIQHSYDPLIEIDWDAPPVPGLLYVPEHRSSLYGTPLWDRLSVEQRMELTKHEVASLASIGVWFETILMHLLIRHYYDQDPTSRHAQYALTEVADECRHSVMFGKMIETMGCPVYRVTPVTRALGRFLMATADGARMFAAILIAEEILDTLQREAAADENVQPLVRMVSRIHVVEEARHVRYAREELERQVAVTGPVRLGYSRLVIGRAAYAISRGLVNPQVYRSIGVDPAEGRRIAWANPHHREMLKWAAAKLTTFLDDLGLIGGAGMPYWRRSGLI